MTGPLPDRRGPVLPVLLAVLLSAVAVTLGSCATRSPVPASDAPVPPEVVLRWQARNEERTYGYLVFRADRPEGPFLRHNPDIIHVAPGDAGVGSYTYVDRDVEPGRTYYYTLDTVETNGRKHRFSDVLSKTVAR